MSLTAHGHDSLISSRLNSPAALPRTDDNCLETLYPPGSCGFVCNAHTYDCYVSQISESCCDEGGRNCPADRDVPIDCQVGCAIVFPEFFETCHDHVVANQDMDEQDFAAFETQCLDQEGLALVEYALNLQNSGCIIDLSGDVGGGSPAGGHRLLQSSYLTQYFGSTEPECSWDDLDDLAAEVDSICCGEDGSLCAAAQPVCSAACALSMHDFMVHCGSALETILGGDGRYNDFTQFEQRCVSEADPHFFLEAIMHADCSNAGESPSMETRSFGHTVPAVADRVACNASQRTGGANLTSSQGCA